MEPTLEMPKGSFYLRDVGRAKPENVALIIFELLSTPCKVCLEA